MGGILFKRDVPIEKFSIVLTAFELNLLEASRGDPAHQTSWEFLAMLIAVDAWGHRFRSQGTFGLKGDSLGA
eukprot:5793458-Amphidinium_carterae.1